MGKQWCGEFSTSHFFPSVLKEASAHAHINGHRYDENMKKRVSYQLDIK